jgi:hypothetical protein
LRGSPTDPSTSVRHRRTRRTAGAVASAALLLPLLGAAPYDGVADGESGPTSASSAPSASSAQLQNAFASAADAYDVPRSVLLAVSYLQSRWDTHEGAPSVTGGYGPMHLTDARTAIARTVAPHHSDGTEDARGDDSRGPRLPDAQDADPEVPENAELPDRLKTLVKAAELSGIPAERLRTDAAANVAGVSRGPSGRRGRDARGRRGCPSRRSCRHES